MSEAVLLLAAVAVSAAVTSWFLRERTPAPSPTTVDPRVEELTAKVDALVAEVGRLIPAVEQRLAAIERRPTFDPSPIVGRLAAIEGGLADLKRARSAALDLGPVLAAIAELKEPAAAASGDDLSQVKGVGPKMRQQLAKAGVVSFRQIADWTADDVARMDALLDARGRIERDRWVEQCRELVNGAR